MINPEREPFYQGLLGHVAEACDIQRELGVSSEEAWQIQRQRADERLREYERQQAENNVIQFRPRARRTEGQSTL